MVDKYRPGDHYRIDDMSGFKVRASKTRKQWNGLIVRADRFEARHPQDFVRARRDNQAVTDPRPIPEPQWLDTVTSTVGEHVAGSTVINVVSTTGFAANDYAWFPTGEGLHRSLIQSLTATSLTIANPTRGLTEAGVDVTRVAA